MKDYSCRTLHHPLWRFTLDADAAAHNARILASVKYDIHKAISMQPGSTVSYGSEFKPASILMQLLGHHPLWSSFQEILEHGAKYPLQELDHKDCLMDIHDAIVRGNHQSAVNNFDLLKSMMKTEVEYGYALPIPIEMIRCIPNAAVAPLGIVFQDTIDEFGNIKEKARATHDQSFAFSSGTSVNDRVIEEKLTPCQYGHCLLRMLHYIAAARLQFPQVRILVGKFDWRTAYRRAHLAGHSAAECITVLGDIALVALRLTFGGSPCPSLWCTISEICTDLANDLMTCDDWDPRELHSDHAHMIPPPCFISDDVPFASAKSLLVDVPVNIHGKADCYVDDISTICLDLDDNIERCRQAVPFAIDLMGRPVESAEPLPRDNLLAIKKLLGEGQLSECKVFTGWQIDTRRMMVSLPLGKFKVWSQSIQTILKNSSSCQQDLAKLVGRLNHTCFIIPHARHFIGRIRHFADALSNSRKHITIPNSIIADLKLWIQFLQYASAGISINNIVFRKPSIHFYSDACQIGIGGYCVQNGKAWRWQIPEDLVDVVSINALEFAASVINIWMADDGSISDLAPLSCVLSSTDSTSAACWLHKSSFTDSHLFEQTTARKLARIMLSADSCLYSQWVAGSDNGIADALSRLFHLDDSSLTDYIYHNYSVFIQLVPVSKEISLWLTLLLRHSRSGQSRSQPERTKKLIQLGEDGIPTLNPSESNKILSLIPSLSGSDCRSSLPLQRQCVKLDSLQDIPSFAREPSIPPSIMWHRSSGQTIGRILD